MSRGAFLIILGKTLKQLSSVFITGILISLFRNNSERSLSGAELILLGIGLCFGMAIILSFLKFFFKKFYISEGNLMVIHGLINRENTSIPLDKIHSLRTQKGILYRIFDMRGIIFDTLASREEELELILSETDWERLLSLIEKEEKPGSGSPSLPPEYNPETTVVFPTTRLLLAALCQNHLKGMAVLGSFFTILFNYLSDLPENTTDILASRMENFFGRIDYTVAGVVLTFAVGYFLILMFWLSRVLLRYADMTMTYSKRLLTFTNGLFTRESSRFYFNKICTIWIKRNFLERKFGFSTIMLRQALNASTQKEDDLIKIYGSDSSDFFLDWWLGKNAEKESDIISAQSGKGLFFISILPPLLISIIAVITLLYFNLLIWIILPIGYIILSVIKGISTMRYSQIHLKPNCILINSGGFAVISNYLKYSNIEVVRLHRTPFTRFTHRVSLLLSTSGTTFRLRSLPESEALLIYDLILSKSER